MALIAISGWIGSGKDTVADYLISKHNFERESLAASLKDAISSIFSWDRDMVEGKTDEARLIREAADEWWSQKLGIPNFSPRLAMQLVGTEIMRNQFHRDIWVFSLESRLKTRQDESLVITDCRFRNELAVIKRVHGKTIWVRRGPLPSWYDIAILANAGSESSIQKLTELGIHESEWNWVGYDFDCIIDNDGSLQELHQKIEKALVHLNN